MSEPVQVEYQEIHKPDPEFEWHLYTAERDMRLVGDHREVVVSKGSIIERRRVLLIGGSGAIYRVPKFSATDILEEMGMTDSARAALEAARAKPSEKDGAR